VVLQFPASFRAPAGADKLERLLSTIPREVPLAVELRHGTWWVPSTRTALESRGAALVWSVIPGTEPPAWITGDLVYFRLVGDRALTKFDRVQRDGRPDIDRMKRRLDDQARDAGTIYGFSNNHFMGFGPGTVAAVASALGEPAPDLTAAARLPGQQVLGVEAPPDSSPTT
jgi:uncharacterized protein YecE (DUF72 family)